MHQTMEPVLGLAGSAGGAGPAAAQALQTHTCACPRAGATPPYFCTAPAGDMEALQGPGGRHRSGEQGPCPDSLPGSSRPSGFAAGAVPAPPGLPPRTGGTGAQPLLFSETRSELLWQGEIRRRVFDFFFPPWMDKMFLL